VPARVTYWTGRWEPDKEAISKEVQALRIGHRATSPVVSIAPGQRFSIDVADRVLRLPTRLWPVLRAAALAIEPTGDVSHVFGGFSSWHLLRALGRRAVILTAVTAGDGSTAVLPRAPQIVAVESEELVDEWIAAGVSRDRIRVVYPGVDLRRYVPIPQSHAGRFQLLFASSPSTAAEFEPRGIPLLVELARVRPDIDIVVPWRRWGFSTESQAALAALHPPGNLIVHSEDVHDMRRYYGQAHATVALFDRTGGKACPNSVLEGFACARPALVSSDVVISPLLERSGAAVVVDRRIEALSKGVDQLMARADSMSAGAAELAQRMFNLERFQRDYAAMYETVSADRVRQGLHERGAQHRPARTFSIPNEKRHE
jgi:glycosyltransferase involved in cell wall biosynthesis